MIETKRCSSCKKDKPLKDFYIRSTSKAQHRSKCLSCVKAHKKEDPFEYKARNLRAKCRLRSKDNEELLKTVPSKDQLKEWLKSQELVCYYTGEKLDVKDFHVDHKQPIKRGGTNELSNLCIASSKANTEKGSMTEQEYKQLLELISKWEDGGQGLLRRLRQGLFS